MNFMGACVGKCYTAGRKCVLKMKLYLILDNELLGLSGEIFRFIFYRR